MSYFPWEDNDREGFKNRYKNLEPYEVEDETSHKGKQQHVNVKGGKKHMHVGNKGQHSGKNKNKANAESNKSGIGKSQSEYQRGFVEGYAYAHNSGLEHVYGHSIWHDHYDKSSGHKYGDHVSRNNEHDGCHGFSFDIGEERSYHDGCHGFSYDSKDNEQGFEYDYHRSL
ncbi:hypothetical protein Lal_00001187 [Lupinus albus]|uniref:Uncharacterized protein n=1 Tax=Lupinus albus TaxID=3870 RepID=A0A6A4NKJ7_LUPAL|nr:hypothetical protein Lalb_Chr18g0051131 [Lupinus albus]KAF1891051.1 hypothetical protein Lal_00001187 [Lupinus albus]